jgi:hypothetical protein
MMNFLMLYAMPALVGIMFIVIINAFESYTK